MREEGGAGTFRKRVAVTGGRSGCVVVGLDGMVPDPFDVGETFVELLRAHIFRERRWRRKPAGRDNRSATRYKRYNVIDITIAKGICFRSGTSSRSSWTGRRTCRWTFQVRGTDNTTVFVVCCCRQTGCEDCVKIGDGDFT